MSTIKCFELFFQILRMKKSSDLKPFSNLFILFLFVFGFWKKHLILGYILSTFFFLGEESSMFFHSLFLLWISFTNVDSNLVYITNRRSKEPILETNCRVFSVFVFFLIIHEKFLHSLPSRFWKKEISLPDSLIFLFLILLENSD